MNTVKRTIIRLITYPMYAVGVSLVITAFLIMGNSPAEIFDDIIACRDYLLKKEKNN